MNAQVAVAPTASTLLTAATAGLTGGTPLNDATVHGSATWIAGSTKVTGSTILLLKGMTESRIDLPIGASVVSEIRNTSSDLGCGQTITASASLKTMADHNCLAMPAWYFPATVVAWALQPNATVGYVGAEALNNARVDHLQLTRTLPVKNSDTAALLKKLTRVDIFLDATTHLPVSVRYAQHPDNNVLADISVEIRFSDYRSSNGMLVPYRIQRLLQNSLNLDITVSSVTINSGLSDSMFVLQ